MGLPSNARKMVAILVPVSDSIPGMFLPRCIRAFKSILQMGWPAIFLTSDRVPLDQARQELLEQALSAQPVPTYLLWLDTDMMVDETHIQGLIRYLETEPSADVASALYFKKLTFEPVCFKNQGNTAKSFMPPSDEPTDVDAAGMGCMLIRASAISQKLLPTLEEPKRMFWFDSNSEDVNFCHLLQKAGIRITVLPSIVVPHQGGHVSRWHHDKQNEDK